MEDLFWFVVVPAVLILLVTWAYLAATRKPPSNTPGRRRRRSSSDRQSDRQEAQDASVALTLSELRHSPHGEYRKQAHILSAAERAFLTALTAALPPQTQVFAKLSLPAVLSPRSDAARRLCEQSRIQRRCVDFLVCDEESAPLLIFDLRGDEATADRGGEADAFFTAALAAAGIPLLQVAAAESYDVEQLRSEIAATLEASVAP